MLSSKFHLFQTNTDSSVTHLDHREISENVCRVNIGNADSYPLSSRGLMAFFLCVSSDKLGKNDLQNQAGFALGRSPIRFSVYFIEHMYIKYCIDRRCSSYLSLHETV